MLWVLVFLLLAYNLWLSVSSRRGQFKFTASRQIPITLSILKRIEQMLNPDYGFNSLSFGAFLINPTIKAIITKATSMPPITVIVSLIVGSEWYTTYWGSWVMPAT